MLWLAETAVPIRDRWLEIMHCELQDESESVATWILGSAMLMDCRRGFRPPSQVCAAEAAEREKHDRCVEKGLCWPLNPFAAPVLSETSLYLARHRQLKDYVEEWTQSTLNESAFHVALSAKIWSRITSRASALCDGASSDRSDPRFWRSGDYSRGGAGRSIRRRCCFRRTTHQRCQRRRSRTIGSCCRR